MGEDFVVRVKNTNYRVRRHTMHGPGNEILRRRQRIAAPLAAVGLLRAATDRMRPRSSSAVFAYMLFADAEVAQRFSVSSSVRAPRLRSGCDARRQGRRAASPEDVWLSRIGTGPAQTARVCGRGATDRVATALCNKATPPIRGLDDLYRALRLDRRPSVSSR